MAKKVGAWGIDIGQCAFKALRCTLEDGNVVAEAFDYIEYPKILSQPEAEPEGMIRDAFAQFLSRNEVSGHRVALAVPGQSGLAKFFKPPPVDAKKIPDIAKFEARQQIPFALEDVIWDFQQMGGGAEMDGFALETEVGLFAMKREQVYRAMKPFREAGVDLDIIQLAPLSIYNSVSYDLLSDKLSAEQYDPNSPPPSLVVLSMGTDTTDLVITNGFRVWQRSIPLGGNHFTKQLTKELKLTFAKAEHLKRNARQAEDPKMVFQAMRPVFSDLVTEVQRSVGYFQGIDRKAQIGGLVVLGNAAKLPGLQQYLARNLGYEVNSFEAFSRLSGERVLSAPAFRDNQLSFGACYGLCLQGLDLTNLKTNLVPSEIITERLVRSKKPWAVAAVAAMLLACTFNTFFHYGRLRQVREDREVAGVSWEDAVQQMSSAETLSRSFQSDDSTLMSELERITAVGEELVGNADRRVLWLEILKTVNETLPRTPGLKPGEIPDVEKVPFDQRQEIHVEKMDTIFLEDLSVWFTDAIKDKYIEQAKEAPRLEDLKAAEDADSDDLSEPEEPEGPADEGWIVDLQCYHYFNSDKETQGIQHVTRTLISNLKNGRIAFPVAAEKIRPGVVVQHQDEQGRVFALHVAELNKEVVPWQMKLEGVANPIPVAPDAQVPVVFSMQEMGIDYPVVVVNQRINRMHKVPNPNFEPPSSGMMQGGGGSPMGMMGPGSGGAAGMYDGGGGMYDGGGGMYDGGGSGMAGGMYGSGGATAGRAGRNTGRTRGEDDEDVEPMEPPFLTVPIYNFSVQFCWTERLLSQRLQDQVDNWEPQELTEEEPTSPARDDQSVAMNAKREA